MFIQTAWNYVTTSLSDILTDVVFYSIVNCIAVLIAYEFLIRKFQTRARVSNNLVADQEGFRQSWYGFKCLQMLSASSFASIVSFYCCFVLTWIFHQKIFDISLGVNNFDLNKERLFVIPDLGPNYLQMLSVNDTNRQRVKLSLYSGKKLTMSMTWYTISKFEIDQDDHLNN